VYYDWLNISVQVLSKLTWSVTMPLTHLIPIITTSVPEYKCLLTFTITFDHSSYSKKIMKALFTLL
jgi:hypothetical protein